jgi:predicted naringenin-chalcone synthase
MQRKTRVPRSKIQRTAAPRPRILSVGTANPPTKFTQEELLALFRCTEPAVIQFFRNSHIRTRHLVLPAPQQDGSLPDEDGAALLDKHRRVSLEIGREAIEQCLDARKLTPADVDIFVVVSSTGFLCPGLSAHLARAMGFRRDVQRLDVVGMGCNGAMNGLLSAADLAAASPGKRALLLACEVCSAAYVFDRSARTGVVNSLFGDGAAALLLAVDDQATASGPVLVDFESFLIHEALDAMRFDFVDGRFSFFLDRDAPYVIGEHAQKPVDALLARHGLKRRDIAHWLVHSGGKKVIDSVKYNLGLTEHDVRHTRAILRDFGNLSSASFLFSYQELTREKIARPGDWGVTIAMGPGVSIETGLLRW